MASTWFLLELCACAVIPTGWVGVTAEPATRLICPEAFQNASDNPITYTVYSSGISNAQCGLATNVVFEFVPKGQISGPQLCSHKYPPDACNNFTTSDTCGCVMQTGTDYTYKYTFPVDDSHVGGKIKAKLCVAATGPLDEEISSSCNSISFAGVGKSGMGFRGESSCGRYGWSLGIFSVVLLLDVGLVVAAFMLQDERSLLPVIAALILAVEILIAGSLFSSCQDLPADESCKDLCVGLGVTYIALQILIAVFLIFKLKPGIPPETLICLLVGVLLPVIGIIGFLIYIKLKTESKPRALPPVVEITSESKGKRTDSYKLTWTVPDECNAEITEFAIEYKEKQTKEGKPVSSPGEITVNGREREVMLNNLSNATWYDLTITSVNSKGTTKGTPDPFTFQTA